MTATRILYGAVLTVLGLLAVWWLALDIINSGIPYLLAGGLILLGLATITRKLWLISGAILIVALNAFTFHSGLQGAAAEAAPGSECFLRVVTFNLWGGNDRVDDVTKFLAGSDAYVVFLQEVTRAHGALLRQSLQTVYPHATNGARIVILSKHPILAEGQVDRPGFPSWISLMLR